MKTVALEPQPEAGWLKKEKPDLGEFKPGAVTAF
jgi:hypothetical protein